METLQDLYNHHVWKESLRNDVDNQICVVNDALISNIWDAMASGHGVIIHDVESNVSFDFAFAREDSLL